MNNYIEIHPVQAIFRSMPAPRDVVAHLVEHDPVGDTPGYWTVRLYRDDFEYEWDGSKYRPRSAEDKLVLFNWASDLIRTMRVAEPHCYIEVFERVPHNEQ